jgi:ABC-type multidrug transport system fused ATPase/permease subunit
MFVDYSEEIISLAHNKQSAIKQAAERANAVFVNELPDQFETLVGVGGEKLSGGQVCSDGIYAASVDNGSQRQRIAIARAIVREEQTRILLLDEVSNLIDIDILMMVVIANKCARQAVRGSRTGGH